VRYAVDRNLALLHRFQQRRLGFGRGAIDLVRQKDLRHHRPRAEFERARLRIPDRDSGHVAGEHVGRELQAVEAAAERSGDAFGQHGLAHPGDVLDQEVPLGEQSGDGQFHLAAFAEDHERDVIDKALGDGVGGFHDWVGHPAF
jgi:hypothetical protein